MMEVLNSDICDLSLLSLLLKLEESTLYLKYWNVFYQVCLYAMLLRTGQLLFYTPSVTFNVTVKYLHIYITHQEALKTLQSIISKKKSSELLRNIFI